MSTTHTTMNSLTTWLQQSMAVASPPHQSFDKDGRKGSH
jgi:hypothetical protein